VIKSILKFNFLFLIFNPHKNNFFNKRKMKLIIQQIEKAKRIMLRVFLLIILITSTIKSLKLSGNADHIDSDFSEENRKINNQTNKLKKSNFQINFKLANVSLIFPFPIEQEFRLNMNEFKEANRKSIIALKTAYNDSKSDKGAENNKNFLDRNDIDYSNRNPSNNRITVNEKNENMKCNIKKIKFFKQITQT
jgi:hypothetical protein